jgi:hypothetical protein
MKSIPSEYMPVVEKLLDKTREQRVRWEQASKNSFRSAVGSEDGHALVFTLTKTVAQTVDNSVVISLQMEDQGEKQEIAVSNDLPTTVEEERISDMVEELYRLARHQTLKIDGKIDEVLALLDRA